MLEAIALLKAGKQTIQTEFRVIWPDESVHWLRVEGEVINPPHMYGIVFDRTQAKATEEALKRSQERYQALVEASDATRSTEGQDTHPEIASARTFPDVRCGCAETMLSKIIVTCPLITSGIASAVPL